MQKLRKEKNIGERGIAASQKHIQGSYTTHFHDFFEIEYVLQGSGRYMLSGQTFQCTDGMLFFMTPVDYHGVESEGADIVNVMFTEQSVAIQFLEPFLRYSAPKGISIEPKERSFFETLFSELARAENKTEYSAALLDCLLLKLAQLLPMLGNHSLNSAVSKMHFYVLNNYKKQISLQAAADCAGLTPTYASALFKKEMQISFKEYVDSLRFDYAKKQLLCSTQQVAKICEESGFEDVPNFIRRFKTRYGMTPTQFRAKAALDTQ